MLVKLGNLQHPDNESIYLEQDIGTLNNFLFYLTFASD